MAGKVKPKRRAQQKRAGINLTVFLPQEVLTVLQSEATKELRANGNMAVILIREALHARCLIYGEAK